MRRSILLVGGEREPLAELRRALADRGFEVEVAPDGFYAALVLERERPAAVVVPSPLPDMEARELGQILAGDPAVSGVERVLLPLSPDRLPDAETAELFGLVLPCGSPPERLASLLEAALGPAGPALAAAPALSGTLEAVDFPQLIQLLAETRLPGVLRIGFPSCEALLYFGRGEAIHCAWGDLAGLEAFREILCEAQSPGVPFRYEKLSLTEVFRLPRTIGGPVQRLILAAAVELDEDSQRGVRWTATRGGPAGA